MKKLFVFAVTGTLCALVGAAAANGPANDECGNAIPIADGDTPFSTIGATTDGNPHDACSNIGDDQVGSDIWYTYTATCTGSVTVSTCDTADYDTKLAVYDAGICPPTDVDLLGCNDDGPGCLNFTSELTVPVVAGQAYLVRLGGYAGDTGTGTLNITCVVNDECGNAIPIADGDTPFSTIGATTDGNPHDACSNGVDDQVGSDIWYTYTATCTGSVTVSTCDTAYYDTKLAVYDAGTCPPTDGELLGCNDDGPGCLDFTSELTVPVVAGQTYLVRLGGYFGNTGTGTLNISANADCVANPDHFQCYEAKTLEETPFEERTVTLTDQFGTSEALVDKVKRLCTPVDKNGEGIVDETAHLTCYNIKEATPEFEKLIVVVDNQFGPLTLNVEKQKQLCVPSEKNGVMSDLNRNHYECYQVKVAPDWPAFGAREVDLSDQFTSGSAIVEKPLLLCNPVEKEDDSGVFPIVDGEGHLVCYELNKQPKLDPKPEVTSLDQFGELALTVVKSETLCVPSTKRIVGELCEDSVDFPTCGGDCPPDLVCQGDPVTSACICAPPPVPCESSIDFPTCGGDCGPGEVCQGDPVTSACICAPPPPVLCEASIDFPTCGGDCPPDFRCVEQVGGGICVCEPLCPCEGMSVGAVSWSSDAPNQSVWLCLNPNGNIEVDAFVSDGTDTDTIGTMSVTGSDGGSQDCNIIETDTGAYISLSLTAGQADACVASLISIAVADGATGTCGGD